jgi:hypothetical protein
MNKFCSFFSFLSTSSSFLNHWFNDSSCFGARQPSSCFVLNAFNLKKANLKISKISVSSGFGLGAKPNQNYEPSKAE